MTTFTKSVIAAADNGTERVGVGYFNGGVGATLQGGNSGFLVESNMRFTSVTIPQAATISSATLTTFNQSQTGTPLVFWQGWNADNSGTCSFGGNLPSNVSKTTATGTFNLSTGTVVHTVTTIIQEIINRSGWASGNALNLLVLDNSSVPGNYSLWDIYSAGTGAQLDVTYTTSVPTVNAGAFFNFM